MEAAEAVHTIDRSVLKDTSSVGMQVVENMKITNKDIETYGEIFLEQGQGAGQFNEEEIAEAMSLVQLIEDAERERRYLYDAASLLARIKLEATKCISGAEAAIKDKSMEGLDAAYLLYVSAANNYSDLVAIHKKAIKEARREAFKARLHALTIGIKKVGDGILKIGEDVRRYTSTILSKWLRDTWRSNTVLDDVMTPAGKTEIGLGLPLDVSDHLAQRQCEPRAQRIPAPVEVIFEPAPCKSFHLHLRQKP